MAAVISKLIGYGGALIGDAIGASVLVSGVPTLASKLADVLLSLRADLVAVRAPLGGMLSGSKTNDFTSIANGASQSTTVTVTGAALGDFAFASFDISQGGLALNAYVSATNTVTVLLNNNSGGAVDLASTTIRVRVIPQASFAAPAALGTSVED